MKPLPLKGEAYQGSASFLICYDHSSGRKGRYTVLMLTSDDPVVIGRELPLAHAQRVVRAYERTFTYAEGQFYFGERDQALRIRDLMTATFANCAPELEQKLLRKAFRKPRPRTRRARA